jgi:HlyD family secretion protein
VLAKQYRTGLAFPYTTVVDIVRERPKRTKRYVLAAAGLVALVFVTIAVSRLESRPPSVEAGTLMVDTVRRGTMLRQVRAPGTLEPEQVRFISALTPGRIEALPLRPGARVLPNTELVVMSNPDVQLEALTAQQQLAAAQSQLITNGTQLSNEQLTAQSTLATALRDSANAARQSVALAELDKKGFSSRMEVDSAGDRIREANARVAAARDQVKMLTNGIDQQVEVQKRQIDRLKAIVEFQNQRVASMHVVAGDSGILQELPWELGQWVTSGQVLAKVAQPGHLKAVLKVPETQAKDVTIGQSVDVDTRNGVVTGKVTRIDPVVLNGTVNVDVTLPATLPPGARPDLSVDGTIQIERLDDVLYVGRPAFAQTDATVGLFKVEADGHTAVRQPVTFGRASVTTIEVRGGLKVGDKVIISDMSAWDNVNKVRIE